MSRRQKLPKGVSFPPFAYVPGKTQRHSDDWFDSIKASVTKDTLQSDLQHSEAFRAGLAYLDAGFFWECHEVLEAVWIRTTDPSPERDIVQALIQFANARLKLRMGRPRAADRLCTMVETHLARCPQDRETLGIGISELMDALDVLRSDVEDAL